jgi:hypothetical protein
MTLQHTQEANSTAGMLLSLASALPSPASPLGRRARAIAKRLTCGTRDRSLERRAADLLADLLTETDADTSGYESEGLLDGDFDDL